METTRLLTLEERKKLLHEYHWPASTFPNKKYKGNGTKRECDYYNIPIYSEGREYEKNFPIDAGKALRDWVSMRLSRKNYPKD
jgi:hypothetical protein